MKKIIVYTEGPSDRDSLKTLLKNLCHKAEESGYSINFIPLGGKDQVVKKAPKRAVNAIRNDSSLYIFAVPDLYPLNKGCTHSNYAELKNSLTNAFKKECKRLNLDAGEKVKRFFVHCFKYDLEVLLLAAFDELERFLKGKIKRTWVLPVENQNNDNPPKRIIERLFAAKKMKFINTIHSPRILAGVSIDDLLIKCPQNFAPFYNDLHNIISK